MLFPFLSYQVLPVTKDVWFALKSHLILVFWQMLKVIFVNVLIVLYLSSVYTAPSTGNKIDFIFHSIILRLCSN